MLPAADKRTPETRAGEPRTADQPLQHLYLPDFCESRAVLAIVLIAELTALTLSLARAGDRINFWSDIARTSMFLLWLGLSGAGLLCWTRQRLSRTSVQRGSMLALAMIVAMVTLISEITYQVGRSGLIDPDSIGGLFPQTHAAFLLRNMAIAFIVTGLTLRYFFVTHEWRRNVEMQAQARVHALQARIRPHFLFNSMNTIASLTRSNPAQAEEAVQDLADLFRANLSEKRNQILLREEIEVAEIYQRIEKLRLGERLRIDWHMQGAPSDAIVPSLLIQPLLENAIYHGIEPRPQGGTVTITGEMAHELITIVVRNPVPDSVAMRDGNRLALANIRERLDLVYGERAAIKSGRFGDEYIVTIRFPYVHA